MTDAYWLHPEQASLIIIDALALGIPPEHLNTAIRIAEKGYTLGYGDRTMGLGHNTVFYDPQEILKGLVAPDKLS